MESQKVVSFESLAQNVGRFNIQGKKFLIPQMNKIGGHLLAGTFRGFGIQAILMETYKGMDLGKQYTSGKECYPCQVTMGDVLYFLKKEKERLGEAFNPEDYVYFMPESDGPCRFGVYNKYQRIVLDSFPEFRKVKIGALTTKDGYSLEGIIEEERVGDLRKVSYLSVIVADILDRLLWRVRPYEKEKGITDEFIEQATGRMEKAFEDYGAQLDFDKILEELDEIVAEAKELIDPSIPPKPLIGIVGEIYLRTHEQANQNLIGLLEKHGAEVVNASIAEWVNYTTYDRLRDARNAFRLHLKQARFKEMREDIKKILGYGVDLFYQQGKQKKVYERVRKFLNIPEDHKVAQLEKVLKREDLFTFDVGTEACLSIAGILEYAHHGFNGVVNVYPFTCMPSTATTAIVKPLMNKLGVPYLDTPYDDSFQPGREAAIRTFMYQAHQHFRRHGRNLWEQ